MSKRLLSVFFVLSAGLLLSALSLGGEWIGRLVQPGEVTKKVQWIKAERKSDLAIRKIRETRDASFQIVRLNTAEKPHVHQRHDLTIFVLKGKALMHLENEKIKVRAGDVIDIPRGTPHWVENRSHSASEVYAVFTPAFDGQDTVFLDIPVEK